MLPSVATHSAPAPPGIPVCSQCPWDRWSPSELDAIFLLRACPLSGCCWQFCLVPRCTGPRITLVLLWSRRPQEKFIRWWAQSRKQCPQAPDEFQLSTQKQFCCLSSSSRRGDGPSQILFGCLPCPAVLLTGWSFSCRKISLARNGEKIGWNMNWTLQ